MMSDDFQQYEEIEAYLANQMTKEQRLLFEQKLTNDDDLANEVQLHQMANDFIVEQRIISVQEKMKMFRPKQTISFPWKKTLLIVIGISSAIAILLFFVSNDTTKKNSQLSKKIIIDKKDTIVSKIEQNKLKDTIKFVPPIQNKTIIPITTTEQKNVDKNNLVVLDEKNVESLEKEEKIENEQIIEEKAITPVVLVKEKNPCEDVKIMVDLSTTIACEGEPNGKIMISNTRGGAQPYQYSLNKKEYYSFQEFGGLLAGKHTVFVKDARNCETQKRVEIQDKKCIQNKEFVFNPQYSVWQIPFNMEKNAQIRIMDKQGNVVFKSVLNAETEYEWNGRNQQNMELPLGLYIYFIEYQNGEIEQGYITLVR